MTEKELIRKTEQKLRLYNLMRLNIENLKDDIQKLEDEKERTSGGIVYTHFGGGYHGDNFNLCRIEEKIEQKRILKRQIKREADAIDRALESIKGSEYFFLIESYYLKCETIQAIIDRTYISRATFFNQRNRLLKKIGYILYPEIFAKLSLEYR